MTRIYNKKTILESSYHIQGKYYERKYVYNKQQIGNVKKQIKIVSLIEMLQLKVIITQKNYLGLD